MPRPAGLARARRHVVGAHRRALADPQEREATVRSRNRLARGPGAPRVSRRMRGAERTRSGLTWKSPWLGLALGALVVAAITLILYPLTQLDPGVSSGVLYVLGVLLLATHWGLITSAASALALDYSPTGPSSGRARPRSGCSSRRSCGHGNPSVSGSASSVARARE